MEALFSKMFGGDFGVFLRLSQRDPIQDLVGQNLSAVNNGRISYKYGWSEICVEDAEKHKLCTIYSEKCHHKCHIHVSLVVKCARHPTLMCHIRMVGQSSGTVPAELKFPYQIGWWRLPWKHKKWPYTGGQRIFRKDRLHCRSSSVLAISSSVRG